MNEQPTPAVFPPKKKKNPWPWIILGIVGGLILIIAIVIVSAIAAVSGGSKEPRPGDRYIGVLHIEGTISSTTEVSLLGSGAAYNQEYILYSIEEMKESRDNLGILLYVNTPGGEMYAGDDVYQALLDYKQETGRPVYAYFAEMACSGGYYVSMAADKIAAHRMTMTGSIGVTYGTHIDVTGLCEKLGISAEEITSGDNKAMGSYFSPLTDEQRAIYASLIDEYYGYFIDVIEKGRGMERADVLALADGRVYSAKQAMDAGLIDEIVSYEDFRTGILDEMHLPYTTPFYDYQFYYTNDLSSLFGQTEAGTPGVSDLERAIRLFGALKGPLAYYSGN